VALKDYMEENNLPGTIIFLGCPAEEMGCGKAFMAREGVFDELDVALSWHPGDADSIMGNSTTANIQVEFSFEGVSSHASSMPHLGRSALDAAELMNIGVQFLREHIIQDARVHYAFQDAGGIAPNVVQSSSRLLYYIRAPKAEQCLEIFARIKDIAKGAALMTGTQEKITIKSAMLDLLLNDTLGKAAEEAWQEIGLCNFSQKAYSVTEELVPALPPRKDGKMLESTIPTYMRTGSHVFGSTDVGDVSYRIPTVLCWVTTMAKGTPSHSWQRVAQGATAVTHEGMLHAGKVLARIALRALEDPDMVAAAKKELRESVGDEIPCLIPQEVQPSV
jgi:aminobenzoyl-glutamate utilization protein B